MRYTMVLLAAVTTGCASTPDGAAPGAAERCSAEECFRQRDVRRVEVLDDENLIVYAGPRECPFRVEVSGFACRLGFALDVSFVQREPGSVILGDDQRYTAPQRVCAFTPRLLVYTGIFDQARDQAIGGAPESEDCRVVDIDALTDDELVELYVDRRLAPPPPPVGGGRLETPEQDDDEAAEDPAAREAEPGAEDTEPGARDEEPGGGGGGGGAP